MFHVPKCVNTKRVTHDCCMLSLSACMLHFDLVSILFGTSIPTSFNILVKMFLHLLIVHNYNDALSAEPSAHVLQNAHMLISGKMADFASMYMYAMIMGMWSMLLTV